jgi:hypothetical protein
LTERVRGFAASILLALVAAGCSVASAGTDSSSAVASRHAAGGLPVSTVSSHRRQPQPPAGSCHAGGSGLFTTPDPRCTPGAIDPAVTQADIGRTICRSGYSESVRPPESITEDEKRGSLAAYGLHGPLHAYEYDHLVSLELGGARNDRRNLWPERGASPNPKDAIEDHLHRLVCDGRIRLAAAQLTIARHWVAAYRAYKRGD